MRQTRKHTLAGVWIVFIGIVSALLHIMQFSPTSMLQRELLNSLHGPGFGVIAVVSMLVLRTWNSPVRAYTLAAVFASGLGVFSELLQFVGPRDADLGDLLRDFIGIAGLLGVAALLDRPMKDEVPVFKRSLSILLVCLLAFIAVSPTTWLSYAIYAQQEALPSILRFDSRWEKQIYATPWRMSSSIIAPPDNWPLPTGKVALLAFDKNRDSGFEFYPYPNWSGFSGISFLASSPTAQAPELSIRIKDKSYGRQSKFEFRTTISVGSSPVRYLISIDDIRTGSDGRELDLTAITSVVIYLTNATDGDAVHVDDFRLE